MNKPLDRLRHHVTGAIERGEAVAIVERTVGNSDPMAELFAEHRKVLAQRDELGKALGDLLYALSFNEEKRGELRVRKAMLQGTRERARAVLAKVTK
jgi:hypothetical protein